MGEYQQPTGRSTSDSEELGRRIDQLERKLEQHREHEQLAVKTLRSATSHAIAIRESARREAELTLRKARAEAEKRKIVSERERVEAKNELLRLHRITEQMRRGLSEFLTAKVEELRLESEEDLPASGRKQELEAVLGSAVEARESEPVSTSDERAHIREQGGHRSSGEWPDRLP